MKSLTSTDHFYPVHFSNNWINNIQNRVKNKATLSSDISDAKPNQLSDSLAVHPTGLPVYVSNLIHVMFDSTFESHPHEEVPIGCVSIIQNVPKLWENGVRVPKLLIGMIAGFVCLSGFMAA